MRRTWRRLATSQQNSASGDARTHTVTNLLAVRRLASAETRSSSKQHSPSDDTRIRVATNPIEGSLVQPATADAGDSSQALPAELLVHIFLHLPLVDLLNCRRVRGQ